jgi:hypothetical protein
MWWQAEKNELTIIMNVTDHGTVNLQLRQSKKAKFYGQYLPIGFCLGT